MYNIQEVFILKKVLILSSSPRKGSNSDLLCDAFQRGAQESGHEVKKLRLADRKINPCLACDYCLSHDCKCVQDDGMQEIFPAIKEADVIVLASPVYFHSINAQLKMVFDRTYSTHPSYANKEFYFLFTSAAVSDAVREGALNGFRAWLECLTDPVEKGYVWGKGLSERGAAASSPAVQEAYEMGRKV